MKQLFKLIRYCLLFAMVVSCKAQTEEVVVEILPGIYQIENYIPRIVEKKIAVVANYGSTLKKIHLIDTLLNFGVDIQIVFSPEHGFSGNFDAGAEVENSKHESGKIKIVSLYGNNRKPSDKDLVDIDYVVFDLQDVGVRFYTYISTLHYVMEACAENRVKLIVLDRPNPLGFYIDGPVMEKKHQTFVGMHPVPVVYGMTIGEYAQMINGEGWLKNKLQCDLQVVLCKNYTHDTKYTLPDKPSPNLPDMRSIYLYPTIAFFEGTVVSEGRGTPWPFQVAGHPGYPGKDFEFTPVSTPGASLNPKMKDQKCYGISYLHTPVDSLAQMTGIQLEVILDFYKKMDLGDEFFISYFELLSGTDSFRSQIKKGMTAEEIRQSWRGGLDEFKKVRAKYLLYQDFE